MNIWVIVVLCLTAHCSALSCRCGGIMEICRKANPARGNSQPECFTRWVGPVCPELDCEEQVLGACGCCLVCAAQEGESCGFWSRECAAGLRCKPRRDVFANGRFRPQFGTCEGPPGEPTP